MIDTDALELMDGAGDAVAAKFGITAVAALAYLMFNLFSPPCFAAMGAMNAEIKQKKWLFGGIALQLGVGYTVGYLVYTIGTLITAPAKLALWPAVFGGLGVLAIVAIVIALIFRADRKVKAEATAKSQKKETVAK